MEIRRLETPREYLEAEELQRKVWQFPDREIIPLNELVALQQHGGHVFGAFDKGRIVSFCFGCPAYRDGRPYHYSRLLGTLPDYQDDGIGYRMKLKQRAFVLEQGLDLVAWTYDPLLSRNAYFNVEKLGVVAREYRINLYPASNSRFNRGLESDRFSVEWWIRSRRVRDRVAGKRADYDLGPYAPAVETRATAGGWREPLPVRLGLRERTVSVEIPDDLAALKGDSLALARTWRVRTREAFLAYFKRGYVVHGFRIDPVAGRRRGFYLLEKDYRVR